MTPIEAYALAKNIATSAVSGVKNISVNGTKLIIETNDGESLEMVFPTPEGIKIGYYDKNNNKFYKNEDLTGEIQGKDELLYIDKDENKLYHWNKEISKFQLLAGGGNNVKFDSNDFDYDDENEMLSLKALRRFFIGTTEEWESLTVKQKQKYILVYLTDDENENIVQGIPMGGTTGQVLTKQSDNDEDVAWESFIKRSGTFTTPAGITNGWLSTEIIFDTPMPNTNYYVVAYFTKVGVLNQNTPYVIEDKTVNGFTFKIYHQGDRTTLNYGEYFVFS